MIKWNKIQAKSSDGEILACFVVKDGRHTHENYIICMVDEKSGDVYDAEYGMSLDYTVDEIDKWCSFEEVKKMIED